MKADALLTGFADGVLRRPINVLTIGTWPAVAEPACNRTPTGILRGGL